MSEDRSVNGIPDHLQPFLDSLLVDELAQKLLDIARASRAEPPAHLAVVPIHQAQTLRYIATATFRRLVPTVVSVAEWRAAEAVAAQVFGRDLDQCSERDARFAKLVSTTAILTYELHLKGFTVPHEEQRTLGIIARVKAKFAALRADRERRRFDEIQHNRIIRIASQTGTWPPVIGLVTRNGNEVRS